MSRHGVQAMLFMLDRAFEADDEHSVISNLTKVGDHEWEAVPPGGRRNIHEIVHHIATAYHAYHDNAFTDDGQTFTETGQRAPVGREAIMAWLLAGHEAFRAALVELDDEALLMTCDTHWGGSLPVREIVATMIGHDAYHAGEINHLRALLQRDDAWFAPAAK